MKKLKAWKTRALVAVAMAAPAIASAQATDAIDAATTEMAGWGAKVAGAAAAIIAITGAFKLIQLGKRTVKAV